MSCQKVLMMFAIKSFWRKAIFGFFIVVVRRGARLADEVRGAAKRRGRGLGQHNIILAFFIILTLITLWNDAIDTTINA